jgi:hypothetical protein
MLDISVSIKTSTSDLPESKSGCIEMSAERVAGETEIARELVFLGKPCVAAKSSIG